MREQSGAQRQEETSFLKFSEAVGNARPSWLRSVIKKTEEAVLFYMKPV